MIMIRHGKFVKFYFYSDKIFNNLVFFSTAFSVDEMMVRFFGCTCLNQYLPSKPDRYGIKVWALCSTSGYIFNLDVYCESSLTNGISTSK